MPTRTDLRDKKHGRIYRVVYGDGNAEPFTLKDASPEKLVATLKHPTMLWRKHAQRLLVERGKTDVVPALIDLTKDRTVDKIGLNVGAIHALWTLKGLGQLDDSDQPAFDAVKLAMQHPSAGVRRNAIQVLPQTAAATAAVVAAKLIRDGDAQVRLAALLALADLPSSLAASNQILQASLDGFVDDQWLRDAMVSAAVNQGQQFLVAASESGDLSGELLAILQIAAGDFARRQTPASKSIAEVLTAMSTGNPTTWGPIIEGLSKGWPDDVQPELDDQTVARLEP